MFILSQNQKKELRKIAKKFKLELILLFGSFVSQKSHKESDLDIAILSRRGVSFLDLHSAFLKIFPGQQIDLTFINEADPLLLKEISDNYLLLYGSKRNFLKFKLNSFFRYQDYRPFFALEKRAVKNFIKSL